MSGILGLAGLLCMGLSGLSFLDSTLAEFALAGLLGVALLLLALLTRIANGIRTKQVDGTTGGLSIVAILGLAAGLMVACLVVYLGYVLLFNL